MFNRKLAMLAVVVVIAPMVLVACRSTQEPAITATPEPQLPPAEVEGLWYPLDIEPPTLDIQMANDTTTYMIIRQCIEGLFEYRGDGSIEPAAATDYEASADGLVYTIYLREGAVWSDGEPVVAQQFVDGVIRLLQPETAAEYAYLMYDIEGAAEFNIGSTKDPSTVGMRALDDYTLEVTLAGPRSYFETVLPFSTFYPVRLDIVEKYGDQWTEPGNYVSNGPYLLEYWEHETQVGLVKNPTYWDAENVTIERITFPILMEAATELALYENGDLHVAARVPSTEMARVLEDPVLREELQILPRPGVYYIGLNTQRPPTDDVNVRKALAAAIDRENIIHNEIERPWRQPMSCTTPPNILGYQPYGTCGHAYNVEAAQEYLADAGFPEGEGFPVLQLWYNRAEFNEEVMGAVANMWEENLGIQVELRTSEWAVYQDYLDTCNESKKELAACEFNAYRMGWVMDYGDPQNQLQIVFSPDSPYQFTGWESEYYSELMDLAASELDMAKREEYYREADAILCEDEVAVIPLISYDRSVLVKEGVTFEYPPFGAPSFKHWALP